MPLTHTQDIYQIRAIDVVHINPSIMEGERLYSSLLGPDVAVRLNRYPPTNLQAPVITGDFKIPSVLTCSEGVWDAAPQPQYTYQWYHDGAPIAGATSNTWTSSLAFDANSITCIVTATNNQGSLAVESNNIIVEIVLPIRMEEQFFGAVSGLNQRTQQNMNHFRIGVASGLWVENYVTLFDHKIQMISGLWVENRLDTETYNVAITEGLTAPDRVDASLLDVGAVSGLHQEDAQSIFENDIYVTEFFEFETALTILNHNAELDLANWTVTGPVGLRTSNPNPGEGTKYWHGGNAPTSSMNQDVAIPLAQHASVDAGDMLTELEWIQSSFDDQDEVVIYVEYFDALSVSLGTGHSSVPATAPKQTWTWFNPGLSQIPPNTRTIRVIVNFNRTSGANSDGYVDDIKLNLWKSIHAA